MRITICVYVFLAVVLSCDALNCRSDTGPKENELKLIYTNCLKRQENQSRNNSRNRNYADDDWRDSRGYNSRYNSHVSQWDRDGMGNRDSGNHDGYFDDVMDDRDYNNDHRRLSNRGERTNNGNDRINRDDRMKYGADRMNNRDDRIKYGEDRMNNRDDRMATGYGRIGNGDRMNNRNERFGTVDERTSHDGMERYGYGREHVSRQDEMGGSVEYENKYSPYDNIHHSSTQNNRRYKREKRLGATSVLRSKYNPNTSKRPTEYDDTLSYKNDEKNASANESSKNSEKIKACALHCFMENLEMTGDNGMPDKYLVTHVITKDISDEDLRDFLQESIEECFQILSNENTEDKCEFSKNLLLCLSEKGKANCDDWKEDLQF